MKLEYFVKWFRAKKRPISSLTLEEAEVRHVAGLPYVVTITPSDRIQCVVDLASDWVSVLFMDEHFRPYLSYDFKKTEENRIFLSKAIHNEYIDQSDKISTSVTFVFEHDGNIFIQKRDHLSGLVEEKESFADPATNWDVYPSFGDYTSLCREERSAN